MPSDVRNHPVVSHGQWVVAHQALLHMIQAQRCVCHHEHSDGEMVRLGRAS